MLNSVGVTLTQTKLSSDWLKFFRTIAFYKNIFSLSLDPLSLKYHNHFEPTPMGNNNSLLKKTINHKIKAFVYFRRLDFMIMKKVIGYYGERVHLGK